MTDSPTPAEPGPVDPDVELASAHLDGEAGADERDRVNDPAVQAHRAGFAAVADQVRDVPPPPPGLLDEHVAAAMGAFHDGARVTPLARPGSTRRWWQGIPFGAVAAGLVIVALIVGIAATTGGDDDATDTAATALDSSGTDDAGDEALSDDGEASAGAGMEESLESREQFDTSGERIAYDSVEALVEDVRARLPSPDDPDAGAEADDTPVAESDPTTTQPERSTDDGDEGAADPCEAVSLLGLDPADVVLVLPAVLTPDEVTVVVHDADDGRRLTVVDDATCTTALDRLL